MGKFSFLAAAALIASGVASTSAGATAIVPVIDGASGSFANPSVSCTVDGAALPCNFSDTVSFVTPTGAMSVSAIINSTFNSSNPATDLNFTSVMLNNGTTSFGFNIVNGVFDQASRQLIPLIANANNTITITGTSAGNTSYSGTLSFAQVAAVPEPATWALMLVGFGAVGASLRRRRTVLLQAA